MALKSSNKVDTNVYEIEVTVAPEEFTQACKDAYLKRRKSIQLPGFRTVSYTHLDVYKRQTKNTTALM